MRVLLKIHAAKSAPYHRLCRRGSDLGGATSSISGSEGPYHKLPRHSGGRAGDSVPDQDKTHKYSTDSNNPDTIKS